MQVETLNYLLWMKARGLIPLQFLEGCIISVLYFLIFRLLRDRFSQHHQLVFEITGIKHHFGNKAVDGCSRIKFAGLWQIADLQIWGIIGHVALIRLQLAGQDP